MIISFDVDRSVFPRCLDDLKREGVEIRKVEEVGPAGGNPRLTVLVDDRKVFDRLGDFYFG